MSFVVIVKMQKDIGPSKDYPPNWPRECEEFATFEDATAKYPGKIVYTSEQYAYFKEGLDHAFAQMQVKRPGFFKRLFGGKK